MTGYARPWQVVRPLVGIVEAAGFALPPQAQALGFTLSYAHLKPLREGSSGWVRVEWSARNRGPGPRRLVVVCRVGIHHEAAAALVADVEEREPGRPDAIVQRFLAQLVPGHVHDDDLLDRDYVIPRDRCPPEFVERFRRDFLGYGVPWMERMASIDELSALLRRRKTEESDDWPLWVPALFHVAGRRAEAVEQIEWYLRNRAGPEDSPLATHCRALYERYRRRHLRG